MGWIIQLKFIHLIEEALLATLVKRFLRRSNWRHLLKVKVFCDFLSLSLALWRQSEGALIRALANFGLNGGEIDATAALSPKLS